MVISGILLVKISIIYIYVHQCFTSSWLWQYFRQPCIWPVTVIVWPVSVNHFSHLTDITQPQLFVFGCPARSLLIAKVNLKNRPISRHPNFQAVSGTLAHDTLANDKQTSQMLAIHSVILFTMLKMCHLTKCLAIPCWRKCIRTSTKYYYCWGRELVCIITGSEPAQPQVHWLMIRFTLQLTPVNSRGSSAEDNGGFWKPQRTS